MTYTHVHDHFNANNVSIEQYIAWSCDDK